MDVSTAKLAVCLEDAGVRLYHTRHEAGAVGLADGFARATSEVGVAIVGHGPAFTNALTAVATAAKNGSGMLVIAADAKLEALAGDRRARRADFKFIGQRQALAACGINSIALSSEASFEADFAAAFDQAQSGAFVVVMIPSDLFEREAGSEPTSLGVREPNPSDPDPSAIATLVELLETTWAYRRPLILAGRGAVQAGARQELADLGEATGAVLATTLLAKSFFDGLPYNIGVIGYCGTSLALALAAEADLILAFGASLNEFTTYGGEAFPQAQVIQIDTNRDTLGLAFDVELEVCGDVREVAATVVRELRTRNVRSTGYRTEENATRIASFAPANELPATSPADGLDPRLLMARLNRQLPRERVVVIDPGHHLTFSATYLDVPEPDALLPLADYLALGSALGPAIGAAIGRPDRLAVLCIGDGGLMMSLGDLDTAVRYEIPLVIVVSNDSAFGSEVHFLNAQGLPDGAARFENPSFAAVARALGAAALTVEKLDDLEGLSDLLRELRGPLLLDCRVTTEVRAEWTGIRYSARTKI